MPDHDTAVLDTTRSPSARLRPIPVGAVRLSDGFWRPRRAANAAAGIPQQFEILKARGLLDNFRRVAAGMEVTTKEFIFRDSDLYKWMEAAAYALLDGDAPVGTIRAQLDEAIDAILPAQGEDGYLNTSFGNDPARRFHNIAVDHELYCAGHLIQAAIAHHRVTGERRLLDAAIRFADYLTTVFGPGLRQEAPGHPEIELALVELYRETGERRYLDLAGFFLERSGTREAERFEGHAVRAAYCAAGAADYVLETGDEAWRASLERRWQDMVRTKLYVTGGIGGRYHGESVGTAYELPNQRAYAETCAALATIFWNWRMMQLAGEARFADELERTLYNGALACAGCHLNAAVAPTTEGTWTRATTVRMEDPALAGFTPEEFLIHSIVLPNEYVAPGYPAGVMPPNFGDRLTYQDLADLIAYLQSHDEPIE